jgi:hypothetical protein
MPPEPITIALAGQIFTQSPQPTHIVFDISMGGSKESSWTSRLWEHEGIAIQRPSFGLHVSGLQRLKSTTAHFEATFIRYPT